MGDLTIKGGPTASHPAAAPAPRSPASATAQGPAPAGPGPAGALGLGLPVQLDPGAAAAEPVRDVVIRGAETAAAPGAVEPPPRDRPESADLRRAANPFARLAEGAAPAPARSFSAASVGLERPVDVSLASLARLAHLEAKAGAEHSSAFHRVRQGNLLVTSDGQGARAAKAPLDGGALARCAAAATAKAHDLAAAREALTTFVRQQAHALTSTQLDVQAFVQRVLREAYLVQNELLYDMAEKVKFTNGQKQRLRERLQEARQTLADWRGQAKSGEPFVAAAGFAADELGDDGEWRPRPAAQQDVDAWQAAMAAAAEVAHGEATAKGSFAAFTAASKLTGAERALVAEARSGQNAEWIEHNGGQVRVAIGKMNRRELDAYVLGGDGGKPLIAALSAPGMFAVIDVLTSLSPAQALYLVARQIPNDPVEVAQLELLGIKGYDGATAAGAAVGGGLSALVAAGAAQGAAAGSFLGPVGTAIGALFGTFWGLAGPALGAGAGSLVGDEFADSVGGVAGLSEEQEERVLAHYKDVFARAAEELGAPAPAVVDRGAAGRLLLGLNTQQRPGEGGHAAPPAIGEPLSLSTPEQLQAYIDGLEDQLNTQGDDAQLANVDLQNALQTQQQVLQMLSNVSKVLHDTAMANIRRIGG